MKKLFSLIILLLFSTTLWSAPAVTGVSGTVTHGQSITVTGSGFGTKSTAAPNLWDTVDNQTSYGTIVEGATVPNGSSYPWHAAASCDGSCSLFSITSGEQRSTHSTACYHNHNSYYNLMDGRDVTANYVYLSWWFKTNQNLASAGSNKFLRMNQGGDGDITNTLTWAQLGTDDVSYVYRTGCSACTGGGHADYCGCDQCSGSTCTVYDGSAPSANTWHFFEAWFDNTGSRKWHLRIDNSACADATFTETGIYFNYVWKIGMDAGGSPALAQTSFLDDIYVDTAWSRVLIGDASTYANCTHFEMQPPTVWNANGQSIAVTVNQGSLPSSPTKSYVYVVASDGSYNASGYEVAFGDGGGDTTPDQFTFTDITGAARSTVYTSNQITVAGIDATADVTITGGTYSKNGGAYTANAGTCVVGDTFTVRQTSSASYSTTTNAILTIGGVSDTYSVTTGAQTPVISGCTISGGSVQ